MKTRIISGIVAAIGFLCILYFGGYTGISILAFVVTTLALYEFSTIVIDSSQPLDESRILFIPLGLIVYLISIVFNELILPALVFTLLILFTYFLIKVWMNKLNPKEAFAQLGIMELGILYAGLLPVYLPLIMGIDGNGANWLLGVLAIVFLGDTGAYFVGKRYGKNLLCPAVSPKKTIEGAAGGLLGSIVGILIIKVFLLREIPFEHCVIMGILGGAIAQIGDLCESILKRAYNVKDSGSIMPGHGGILDRCDGLLFAAPLLYYYIQYIVL